MSLHVFTLNLWDVFGLFLIAVEIVTCLLAQFLAQIWLYHAFLGTWKCGTCFGALQRTQGWTNFGHVMHEDSAFVAFCTLHIQVLVACVCAPMESIFFLASVSGITHASLGSVDALEPNVRLEWASLPLHRHVCWWSECLTDVDLAVLQLWYFYILPL